MEFPVVDVSVVVPAFQSAECVEALVLAVEAVLSGSGLTWEMIVTDDASPDDTWAEICRVAVSRPWLIGQRHRKGFGQHNGIMSGLRLSRGRFAVIMDDDLQHDPADILALLKEAEAGGHDVVFANFSRREHRTWKRLGSWFNGKVAEWLLEKPPHIYLSPFKILRREVVEEVLRYEGPEPYVDGLVLRATRRLGQVTAKHRARHAGKSSYSFRKSIALWARLAFSFSLKPLRLATWLGAISAAAGFLGTVLVVFLRISLGESFADGVAGWASLMTVLLFFGGMQMVLLGILGEYVGRIHLNLNRAPQQVIAETINGPGGG